MIGYVTIQEDDWTVTEEIGRQKFVYPIRRAYNQFGEECIKLCDVDYVEAVNGDRVLTVDIGYAERFE